jgi:hypothetical protein
MAVLSCWISKVKSIGVTVVVVAILFDVPFGARAWSPQHGSAQVARRTMLETTVPTAVAVGALSSWIPSWKSHAATAASTLQLPTLNELPPTSLAVRLAQRNNAAGLPNRLFNVPPKAQVFPVWLRSIRICSKLSEYLPTLRGLRHCKKQLGTWGGARAKDQPSTGYQINILSQDYEPR